MHESKDHLPKPMGTLEEVLDSGGAEEIPRKAFVGHNLGGRTFLLSIPMHEFFRYSEVANDRDKEGVPVAQRKLDPKHANKLAVYILKGLVAAAIEKRRIDKKEDSPELAQVQSTLGTQPYMSMQPIVANIRSVQPGGRDLHAERMVDARNQETAGFRIFLGQEDILWVVDGQHRRKAMQLVFDFLDVVIRSHQYPKKGSLYPYDGDNEISHDYISMWQECFSAARLFCTVMVEAHLGLEVDQERQLFHDLNNLGKKVSSGLALEFDNSNPVNLFMKEVLIDDLLDWEIVEKDVVNWKNDTGAIARKHLVAVNAMLFLNKTNISGATPPVVDSRKEVAIKFWNSVREIPYLGGEGARLKTVSAQPVILKALAKLVFDFAFSSRKKIGSDKHLDVLLSSIQSVDWSHSNPMWRYYEFGPSERSSNGLDSLSTYLPSDDEGYNRDIGGFDSNAGVMRFGPKHNDIYPILGDMIRWTVGLPNRNQKHDESKQLFAES